jgi:RsiW-degrading membrane proteinase PrsW (M82 family)
MSNKNANDKPETDNTMMLIIGLTISTLILLGVGVYYSYTQFFVHSGAPGVRDLAVIVAMLLSGAVLGARVLLLVSRS